MTFSELDTAQAATGGYSSPPVAQAVSISKRFGATVALNDTSLAVRPGTIHALVGRNGAGKSTLVSMLTGLAAPDAGRILFNGSAAPPLSDRDAWRQRVACVYQKLTVIDGISISENLFLNRQGPRARLIRWGALHQRAQGLLDDWGIGVDARAEVSALSLEQRQLLEIARALSFGARFVILDEPTARLDAAGIAHLFKRVRDLREQGVTFLFISHHLHEIFDLCDQVTVLRDARHIVTGPVSALSHSELVEAMTGEKLATLADPRPPRPATSEPILSVRELSESGIYDEVNFDVAPGEIVGLAGSGSSGKFSVAEAITGQRRPTSGFIDIKGKRLRPGSVTAALRAGVGFVPEDRHREGFVGSLSIAENLTMSIPHRLGRSGFVSPTRRTRSALAAIARLDIVPPRPMQPVNDLSGGNQQKVVTGRAVADEPAVLVLMAPTAGVDVKSKQALMTTAMDAARAGSGVLVVTDDLEDLRYCHRVLVLFKGRQTAELADEWADTDLVAAMEGLPTS